MSKYDDIINLPHHVSTKHPQMSMYDRAAQFAPFSALVGYDAVVAETSRRTENRPELDEQEQRLINERLRYLLDHIEEQPEVHIKYFVPDTHKSGGAIIEICGKIATVSESKSMLELTDGTTIYFADILELNDK